MSSAFELSQPVSLDYEFELTDGPVVPTIWEREGELLKVDRVVVSVLSDFTIQTTVRGFRIKKDGERDKRFAMRESADRATSAAYTSFFISRFSDHALEVLDG